MREEVRRREEIYDPIGAELLISMLGLTLSSVSAYLGAIPLLKKKAKKSAMLRILRGIRDQADLLGNAIDEFKLLLEKAEEYNPDMNIMGKLCTVKNTLLALRSRDYRRWYEINDKLSRIRVATNGIQSKIAQMNLEMEHEFGLVAYDKDLVTSIDIVIRDISRQPISKLITKLRHIVDEVSFGTRKILARYK